MAEKFKIHFIHDLKKGESKIDDIEQILIFSTKLRLIWGAEYVDFIINKSEDIEKVSYENELRIKKNH